MDTTEFKRLVHLAQDARSRQIQTGEVGWPTEREYLWRAVEEAAVLLAVAL